MLNIFVTSIFLTALCGPWPGAALMCYKCNSDSHPNCANNPSDNMTVDHEPSAFLGGPCIACSKSKLLFSSSVKRDCVTTELFIIRDGCSGFGSVCYCRTDLCNRSVTMATPAAWLLLLFPLGAILTNIL